MRLVGWALAFGLMLFAAKLGAVVSKAVPNAAGDLAEWDTTSGYTYVDDGVDVPDDGSSELNHDSAALDARELYHFANGLVPTTATISNVRVLIRCGVENGSASETVDVRPIIKIGGQIYSPASYTTQTKAYVNTTYDWTTNPNSGSAWTAANIDALQIGVQTSIIQRNAICTLVQVEVTWTLEDPNQAAAASGDASTSLSFSANAQGSNIMIAYNTSSTFGTPSGTYSAGNAISGGGTVIFNGTAASSPYTHTSLSNGTTYYYKFWSVDGSLYSTGVSSSATPSSSLRTVSGNVYSDDDNTASNVSGTIRIRNLATNTELGSTVLSSQSAYSILINPPSNGTLCVVYLDSSTTVSRCMRVFIWNGTGNQTGLNLRTGFVRFDKNGSGTNFSYDMTGFANLDSGDNATRVIASATTTAFIAASNVGIQLKNGAQLSTSSGGTLTCRGNLAIDSGTTLVATGATVINLEGDWIQSGTFTFNTSTVVCNGTTAFSGTSTIALYSLKIQPGASLTAPSGELRIAGDFTNNGSFVPETGTVVFNGGGNQSLQGFTSTFTTALSESFEAAGSETYTASTDPLTGLAAWKYEEAVDGSQLRLAAGSAYYHGGSNAATIDSIHNSEDSTGYLIATVNVADYTTLRLSFWFTHHLDDAHTEDRVWVRASSSDSWLEIYDWHTNRPTAGVYKQVSDLDVSELLDAAGQTPTSTFQIRFGHRDDSDARTNATDRAGFTVDDVTLTGYPTPTTPVDSIQFYNLKVDKSGGTLTLGSHIDLDGNLDLAAGTLDVSTSNYRITVAQNFARTGTFTPRSGEVVFDTTATSIISGSTTFSKLTCVTPGKQLTLTAGSTQTVSSLLKLAGDSINKVLLRSSSTGSAYTITDAGTEDVSFVSVKDCTATTGITASASESLGNNTNWTFGGSTPGLWTGATSTAWNTASNWDNGVVPNGIGVTIPDVANDPVISGAVSSISSLIVSSSAVLTVVNSGNTLSVTGSVTVDGTLTLSGSSALAVGGNWTLTGTFNANTSLVTFNGSSSQLLTGATTFYDLTINNSTAAPSDASDVESVNAITVSNTLAISDGQYSPASGSSAKNLSIAASGLMKMANSGASFTLSGSWTNNGVFTHNASTLTLSGTSTCTFTGSSTFYNLTCTAAGKQLTFPAGSTTTIDTGGLLTLTGSSANKILLRSSSASSTYTIADLGSESVVFVDVQDSIASNGVVASNSTFSNVTNWSSGAIPGLWTGASSSAWNTAANWDNGVVPSGIAVTIPDVTNDPVISASVNSITSLNISAGGNLSINTGQSLLVTGNLQLDGTLTASGTAALTVYGNWTNNGVFSTATGTVTFAGTTNSALLGSGTLNFYHLTINKSTSARTLTPGKALDVNGHFTNRVGTFVAGGYTHAFAGNVINNSVFSGGTATLLFDGPGAQSVQGSFTLANLTVENTAVSPGDSVDVEANTAIVVTGALRVNDGQFSPPANSSFGSVTIAAAGILKPSSVGASFSLSGNWSNSGTFTHNNGTVTLTNSATATTISGNSTFYRLSCTAANKTLNFTAASTQTIATGGMLTIVGSSDELIKLRSTTAGSIYTISDGGSEIFAYADVKDSTAVNSISAGGTSVNSGNNTNWSFTPTPGMWLGDTSTDWNTASNWDDGAVPNGVSVVIPNVANQPVISAAVNTVTNLTINTGSSLSINNGQSLSVTADVSINGTLTLSGSAALTLGRHWTNNGTFTANSSTVTLNGSDDSVISGSSALGFHHLTIAKSVNTKTVTPSTPIDVNGNFTLTTGTFAAGSLAHTYAGNFSSSGIFSAQTSTITLDGSAAQSITGALTFYNLTVNNSAGSPGDAVDVEQDRAMVVSNVLSVLDGQLSVFTGSDFHTVTISTNGILKPAASGGTMTVSGNWSNTGTFTHNNGTVTFDATATATISNNTTFYYLTCTTPGKTLTFAANSTQTIATSGVLTLTGTLGNLITLRSSSSPTQWFIADGGTESVSYTDVKDSSASTGITCTNGTNSGGNSNWTFITQSQPGLWTGTTSTAWTTASNWDDGVVPSGIAVTIPNVTNDPVISSAVSSVTSITMNPGAVLTVATGGSITADGNLSISGTLTLNENSSLTLTNGRQISIASGAIMKVRGTSPAAASTAGSVLSSSSGSAAWAISIADGASLDARGARFLDGSIDCAGTSPTAVIIANSLFSALPSGSTAFLDLSSVSTGTVSLGQLTFTRGSAVSATVARNITANTTTKLSQVFGYAGDLGGETYDADDANRIRWSSNATPLLMKVDANPTVTVNSLAQALESLGSGTVTVWANYADSSSNLVRASELLVGTLRLANFSGTLKLHGFRFETESVSNATLIDLTAVSSGGTVVLYNCMLVDAHDGGTGRTLINQSGATVTINAEFCTLDTSSAATAGLDAATNSLFTRSTSPNYYVPSYYASMTERNLRLSIAGHDAVANATGSLPSGFERDVDGKMRSSTIGDNDIGAVYFGSSNAGAAVMGLSDITGTLSSNPSAVVLGGPPASNSAAAVFYLASSDGNQCFLTAVNRTSLSIPVTQKVSWSGFCAAFPTFTQCTDLSTKYWIYVPYDKDGDGRFDTIRRILHNTATGFVDDGSTSNVDTGDGSGNLANADNSVADITSSSGWTGNLYVSTPAITGSGGTERQVAITTATGGGQIHVFYLNAHSGSGKFYGTFDGTNYGAEARACESYTSGSFTLDPTPSASVNLLGGGNGSGSITITRRVGSGASPDSAVLIRINRVSSGTVRAVATGDIVASLTGPAAGTSFSADPLALAQTSGRRLAAWDTDDKVASIQSSTLTAVTLDLGIGSATYGSPSGILPTALFGVNVSFVPFYNASTGLGAIGAIEYAEFQNGDSTLDKLSSSYSDNRIRFDGDPSNSPNLVSNTPLGSFDEGIATVAGMPLSLLYHLQSKSIYCGTSAGQVYCWTAGGMLNSETASTKGVLRDAFPVTIGSGQVVQLAFMVITDDTLESTLGLTTTASSNTVLGAFTDSGQIYLLRFP